MKMPTVLWIDLRTSASESALEGLRGSGYRFHRHADCGGIAEKILQVGALALIFEYDFPSPIGLRALQLTKRAFPSLPLFMVTEEHSEDLAVWAFRSGVRDFLVKPVGAREVASRLADLPEPPRVENRRPRTNILPKHPIPAAARYAAPAPPKTTLPAYRYIEAHLHEKITLDAMAELCAMSPFQFSRAFKREHGVNFKEFLTGRRIARAQELLSNPNAAVVDIAYAVGFTDPPYFARVFRRLVGLAPSAFRGNGAAASSASLAGLVSLLVLSLQDLSIPFVC
jgi:AraC-like DNA-binding protein